MYCRDRGHRNPEVAIALLNRPRINPWQVPLDYRRVLQCVFSSCMDHEVPLGRGEILTTTPTPTPSSIITSVPRCSATDLALPLIKSTLCLQSGADPRKAGGVHVLGIRARRRTLKHIKKGEIIARVLVLNS